MSLVLRGQIGRRLSISEMDGNFTYLQQLALSGTTSNGATVSVYTQVTYSELVSTINSNSLNPGTYYLITDFKTCYDQPDYNIYGNPITEGNYKVGNTHSILVFATSDNTLSLDAWQPDFPKDKIKYDHSWTQSEITGGTAYGRITERIDEFNNRTDYDHRDILFKRYDTFVYDVNFTQAGTISVLNGIVTGVDTNFTNFSIGNIIAIPYFSELFFKIDTISSATAMSLTGSVWNVTGNDIKYYSIDYTMDRCSYKRNNVDNVSYEISTFGNALENSYAVNNYIGDHSNSYIIDGIGNFLLSNNVFLQGRYYNNKFGNNCFDNTFDDDCSNNTIGNFFTRNITDDDFDENTIANYFEYNLITSNFQRNDVGENFNDNYIIVGSFYRNKIGEQFESNKISGNDFQNNIIGNAFRYNVIDSQDDGFLKNQIGVGYNNNRIFGEFDSNVFGNGSNNNNFYCNTYENKIGDYFEDNIIGRVESTINFYENHIGNDFSNNELLSDFYLNRIFNSCYNNNFYDQVYKNDLGSEFENNTIGNINDIGGYSFRNNKLGNTVKGNLVVGDNYYNEYGNGFSNNDLSNQLNGNKFGIECYGNTIGENMSNNSVGNYFSGNNIGTYFENNLIGNFFQNNTIQNNFKFNVIGNNFEDNSIDDDFGFGGGNSQGNKIGNYFRNNTIGEYFYNNQIADGFDNNIIGNYFQLNDIQVYNLYNTDFTTFLGNIEMVTFNTPAGANNTYTNIYPTGGSGTSSVFEIIVTDGSVSSVNVIGGGKKYVVGDVLTVSGDIFGGISGSGNLSITVTSVSPEPVVYTNTNSTIVKNSNADNKLYYLGLMGFEWVDIDRSYD